MTKEPYTEAEIVRSQARIAAVLGPEEIAKLDGQAVPTIFDAALPVTVPGLYRMTPEQYHSDPCAGASLSSSIANVMLDQSPRHAFAQHPKLGGARQDEPTRQKEIGTAAHRALFGRGAEIVVVDAADYRSNAAKDLRAKAYAENCAPILKDDLATVEAMVEAARDQLLAFPELAPLVDGQGHSETVAIWQEPSGPYCRAMIDWIAPDFSIRADLKTTSTSAHPAAVASRLFGVGAELQDRFYTRGLRRLQVPCGTSVFIMQETEPPYCLSVVDLDYPAQELGDEKVEFSIGLWQRCLADNHWPGYEPLVATAELPGWQVQKWNARVLAGDAARHVAPEPDPARLLEAG